MPKLWIEPVHGIVPGHGFRIDWLGLWFDIAEGVSVQNLQVGGGAEARTNIAELVWGAGPAGEVVGGGGAGISRCGTNLQEGAQG